MQLPSRTFPTDISAMKACLTLFVGLLCFLGLTLVAAGNVTPLTPSVLAHYKDIIKRQPLNLDDASSTLTTLDVISARNVLDMKIPEVEKRALCAQTATKLAAVDSDKQLLTLSLLAEELDCSFTVGESTLKVLASAVASEDMAVSYNGVRSLFSLAVVSPSTVSLDNYDLVDVLRMYKDLQLPDGSTRNSVTTVASSLANTGLATELFALSLAQPSLSATILPDAATFIGQARAAASKYCDAATLKEGDVLLRGVSTLAAAVESVVDVNLNCLVPVVASQASAQHPRNIARVLRVARALTTAPIHSPFFLAYEFAKQDLTAGTTMTVRVTDAFGEKIPNSQFDLAATVDGIALAKSGKNTFQIPEQNSGSHAFTIAATATGPAKGHLTKSNSLTAVATVPAAVTVSKVVLAGSRSKDAAETPLVMATPPFAVATYAVDAAKKDFLIAKVAFASSGKYPPVFSLRFSARHAATTASFPLTPSSKSAASLSLALTHAITAAALAGDGIYDVALDYVASGAAPVAIPIATVTLTGLPAPSPAVDASALPPVLAHTFAPEQRIANPLITTVFIAISALPLLAVLFVIFRSRPTATPLSATESVTAFAFLACLGVCLAYIVIYWLCLSLIAALPMLAVLSAILIFLAHRALSASNQRRGLKLTEDVTDAKKNE